MVAHSVRAALCFGVVAVVSLPATQSHAGWPGDDPVCSKYAKYDAKSINTTAKVDNPVGFLTAQCMRPEACIAGVAALQGKAPKAEHQQAAKDLFHFIWQEGRQGKNNWKQHSLWCNKKAYKWSMTDMVDTLVAFKAPEAAKVLTKLISTDENVHLALRDDIQHLFRGLYWLGEKSSLDRILTIMTTITKFKTGTQVLPMQSEVLGRIALWNPNADQKKKVQKYCEDIALQTELPGFDRKTACFRAMADLGIKSDAAMGHMGEAMGLNPGNKIRTEAIRSWARLAGKKAKGAIVKVLGSGRREYKGTASFLHQPDSVQAAATLFALGDKMGKEAVNFYISYKKDKKDLQDERSYTQLYLAAAFAPAKGKKKLVKTLEGDFKKKLKDLVGNAHLDYPLAVAAVGLAQNGSKVGLKHLMTVLGEPDMNALSGALAAMGSPYRFRDDHKWGLGGLPVGKGGISAGDAGKIVALLQSKLPFLREDHRKLAMFAIFDLNARVAAAK